MVASERERLLHDGVVVAGRCFFFNRRFRFLQQVVEHLAVDAFEAVLRPEVDDVFDLFVRDEDALKPSRFGGVGGHEEHVAAPKQFLGACCVQHGA